MAKSIVRGVNLGNWLVLEKWMGGSPLSLAQAEDDRAWIDEVPADERARLLRGHYGSFVTQQTFEWLARRGINLVRVPVPYHLFGSPHHVGCVEFLDKAFDWAEKSGIDILLDLHTVPYSQNGYDNGGYTALCAWSKSSQRVRNTLALLELVAYRYAGQRALWGIEPLNEPISWPFYLASSCKNLRRHLGRVLRSKPMSRSDLVRFYTQFYERVRPIVGADVKLVFHDRFCLGGWEKFDPGHGDPNVLLDTHQYAVLADKILRKRDLSEYLRLVEFMAARVQKAAQYHPVLVGEWSLANRTRDLAGCSAKETRRWYRAYADAQLAAWDRGGVGSCFWSLRVQAPHRENWSFESCVQNDWLSMSGSQ